MKQLFKKLNQLLITVCLLSSFAAAAQTTATVVYYHTDMLGSPVAATDQSGNLLWRENYAPYGEKLSSDMEAVIETVGYTGHRYDSDTGLVYAGARMYDPTIGRFISVDPVGALQAVNNPMMFNRYAYGNNNPYGFVDPDGNIPVETVWDVANISIGVASFSSNVYQGNYGSATVDALGILVDSAATIIPYVPGGAATFINSKRVVDVTKKAGKAASKSDDVIHVTKDGVALPPGPKHKIPDNYVQNPHRSGSYGEIVDGKFKERLRIDPPTPPGQKGPNYSHYHKDGKGTHYSPRPGDKDPGF